MSVEAEVLQDAEGALRMGDLERLFGIIFVWSQAQDDLRAGTVTWASQRPGRLTELVPVFDNDF